MSKRSVCILIGWWEFFNTRKFSILKFYSVNLSTMPCCCYLATKSCLTLCDPMDCSPPGSSVHGILQAGILEWVAIPLSRVSSRPRDRTHVSYLAGRFFTTKPPGRHPTMLYLKVFFFFFHLCIFNSISILSVKSSFLKKIILIYYLFIWLCRVWVVPCGT